MKNMKQTERLSTYLQVHKKINPLESWNSLGIYRLAAVIFLLRKDGWFIKTNTVKVKNQFGESCHVAEYELGV